MSAVDGAVAVVTGAGSGIGLATARRLAEEGYRVVGADARWGEDGLVETQLTCDVSDPAAVAALFADVVARFGRVDVLVNSAGVNHNAAIVDVTDEAWKRVLSINLFGTFLCLREAGRIMTAQGSGRIVNIASNRGLGGLPNGSPYAASKGGVIALTKSAAEEFAPFGVGVFVILPGATDTPMFRYTFGDNAGATHNANPPEHVAATIVPLLGPDALAFSGASIPVTRKPKVAAPAG